MKIITSSPRMKRGNRTPRMDYNLRFKPWQIQPFFIHPVLPGETMKNMLLMSRCVSDPLKDKLMGWWLEHYVFYVKHTDLDIGTDLVEMHLDASKAMGAFASAADAKMFHNGGINFVSKCLDVCKQWYFRDEDEAEPAAVDGLPPAKINLEGWWNSLKLESELPANEHELVGDNPVIPDAAPAGFSTHYTQWEAMRAAGLTVATFEDYLKSFGVSVPAEQDEEIRRPELIRYSKEFTYPTNTVEPTTGVPSSAAVWSVSERADKDRFFKEPGFLFGVTVVRPKVLLSNIKGTMTSHMDSAYNWLPAIVQDLPFTSVEEFAYNAGPAPLAYGSGTEDIWVDIKDLFLYGEQFRNHDGTPQGNSIALPDTSGNVKFPTTAMADALFATGAVAANKYFRTDGMLSLAIASAAYKDTSG
jgi:hypothetical protein